VSDWAKDPCCEQFLKSDEYERTKDTVKFADVDMSGVSCVFYPGGHGPMWDLATDKGVAKKTAEFYENGGLVAAVCHGPAALIPVVMKNGASILQGKRCTAFTNVEEDIMKLTEVMPFLLETKMTELGAKFEPSEAWKPCVVVDGNLITGQNPNSGAPIGNAIIEFLSKTNTVKSDAQLEESKSNQASKPDEEKKVPAEKDDLRIITNNREDIGTIVIVLTNHNKLGDTGKQTGWYLPELAHPLEAFSKSNKKYRVVFASPNGGATEVDEGSVSDWAKDPCCEQFLKSDEYERTKDTVKFADVDMSGVSCVFYPGGHGPMWDLATDKGVAKKTAEFYENGGLVAAVCHGPAALIPVVMKNGASILQGKRCTAFTNVEEDIMKLTEVMPFLLETKMTELGAKFEPSEAWKPCVVVDGNLITGQNPNSGAPIGNAIIEFLSKTNTVKSDAQLEESKINQTSIPVEEKEVPAENDDLGTIVIILTQHNELGNTGKQTGWYLPELAHPLEAIAKSKKKFDLIFASPLGGKTEVDEGSVKDWEKDECCAQFLKSDEYERTKNTIKYADVDMKGVSCVFYPGGHGPMWDLANDKDTASKTAGFYDRGGLVAAVCHGPAALVPITLPNGNSILDGKVCTGFTNNEEDIVKLTEIVPFALETRMTELGGKFKNVEAWKPCVVVDGNLITGQNPASGAKIGDAIVDHLSCRRIENPDDAIFYVQ